MGVKGAYRVFDTVSLGLQLDHRLHDKHFGYRQERVNVESGQVSTKLWKNNEDEEKTWPRLTYYPDNDYLVGECSLPKMLFGNNVRSLDEHELSEVYQVWLDYCQETLHSRLPDPKLWNVVRVDYCHNWDVGADLSAYLNAVSQLSLSHHKRSFQEQNEGVSWTSKANVLKFYNKHKESGLPAAEGLLRLELTNNATGARYLATKHKVDRTAENLLTNGMATTVMQSYLERLGLKPDKPIRSERGLIDYLRQNYTQRGASARFWFLRMYRIYGAGFWKLGHMKKRAYYGTLSKLKKEGLLCRAEGKDLEPLVLPGFGGSQTT